MRSPIAQPQAGRFHGVRFYESQASLCRTVADFLVEGFAADQPGLIVATPTHRDGILAVLRERNVDVDRLQAVGDFLLLDARRTLSTILVDGMPHPERFRTAACAAIDRVRHRRKDCTVRAYGEMVDLLCQDGRMVAALRLEILWNELAMTHDFSLLCGYAIGSFYKDAGMREICALHSHVIPAVRPASRNRPASIH